MYKDIYSVYCYDKEPLLDPGGGAIIYFWAVVLFFSY